MQESSIKYEDGQYNVEIVVHQATVRDGIQRTLLLNQQLCELKAQEKAGKSADLMTRAVATLTYPACMAATAEVRNLDVNKKQLKKKLTLDEFMELPDALVYLWEDAAFQLNPHWLPPAPKKKKKPEEGEGGEEGEAGEEAQEPQEGEAQEPSNEKSSEDA